MDICFDHKIVRGVPYSGEQIAGKPGGYFSLNDKLKGVHAAPEGKQRFGSAASGFAKEAERKAAGMYLDNSKHQEMPQERRIMEPYSFFYLLRILVISAGSA